MELDKNTGGKERPEEGQGQDLAAGQCRPSTDKDAVFEVLPGSVKAKAAGGVINERFF